METSLNDMSETNGLNEENLSSLKGLLNQVFHLEDKDLRTYSHWRISEMASMNW